MSKKAQFKLDSLTKLLGYILGRRPDEFGLVPDQDGFVQIKDLLKTLHEEEGFGFVRENHFREIILNQERLLFEQEANRIRARERFWNLDLATPCPPLPSILYTPVRRRAHAHAMEKGLVATGNDRYLLLSLEEYFTARVGRRLDPEPVLLQILAERARQSGTTFHVFGSLFLVKEIPSRFIAGPPIPKDMIEERMQIKQQKEKAARQEAAAFLAGTFTLIPPKPAGPKQRIKGKKAKGWKEEVRGLRRTKRK